MRSILMRSVLLVAGLSAAALPGKAYAGDLPGRKSYAGPTFTQPQNGVNWGGVYVGGNLGYGFGSANNADISGFLVGAHAGVNFQVDRAVFGVEADLNYSGVDYRGFTDRFRQKWLMSARGRIGYSFDQFLPYFTAGLAYSTGEIKAAGGIADNTHLGFVLGIGGEYMLTQNVTARAEFLHYRFGSETYNIPLATRNTTITTNVLRVGVSYKF